MVLTTLIGLLCLETAFLACTYAKDAWTSAMVARTKADIRYYREALHAAECLLMKLNADEEVTREMAADETVIG